jgi:uncharacterized SAM-binding protein YcdF (DUF218 family)
MRLVLVGSVVGGLALAHRPILVGFANLFRVDDPVPSDAIVLLLGGSDHRAPKAAELYSRHLAPRILLARSHWTSEPELSDTETCRRVLQRRGVPSPAIEILDGVGMSTFAEAGLVRDYCRVHRLKRILVVTTAFHTARARWVFQRVLRGTGVDIHLAAADHPIFTEDDWYTKDEGLVAYFNESIKALFYRLAYSWRSR